MASTQDYEVLDPHAKDIGGVKSRHGRRQAHGELTRAQAQWFLDQGQIRPVGAAPAVTPAAVKPTAFKGE